MINLKKIPYIDDLKLETNIDLIKNKTSYYLSAIIFIMIIWQLSHLTWNIIPKINLNENIAIPERMNKNLSKSVTSNQLLEKTENIVTQNLFGTETVNSQDTTNVINNNIALTSNLRETSLNLSLKGIIHESGGTKSMAIISKGQSETDVFKTNDMIIPGTSLHSVYSEQIILNTRNGLESLKLPKEKTNYNEKQNIPKKKLTPLKEFGTNLADTIRPTPYFSSGKQVGYRVYPGSDRKKFMSLGLMSGDLIVNINGLELDDPMKAMSIFQNIENDSQVTLTIIRNENPTEIFINSDQFNEST